MSTKASAPLRTFAEILEAHPDLTGRAGFTLVVTGETHVALSVHPHSEPDGGYIQDLLGGPWKPGETDRFPRLSWQVAEGLLGFDEVTVYETWRGLAR